MELIERITYILKNNPVKPGLSEYEFAKSLKTNPSKFSEIRSGKVKSLSVNLALEISKQYKVDFKWILTGEGSMIKENQESKCYDLPVRGQVESSCGYGVEVYNEERTSVYSVSRRFINDIGISPTSSEIIFARGDSMEPTIKQGDSLLIDTSKKDIYDGTLYCINLNGQLYAKRLQKLSKTIIGVVSDNPKYETIKIDTSKEYDKMEVVGEIRWIGRIAK